MSSPTNPANTKSLDANFLENLELAIQDSVTFEHFRKVYALLPCLHKFDEATIALMTAGGREIESCPTCRAHVTSYSLDPQFTELVQKMERLLENRSLLLQAATPSISDPSAKAAPSNPSHEAGRPAPLERSEAAIMAPRAFRKSHFGMSSGGGWHFTIDDAFQGELMPFSVGFNAEYRSSDTLINNITIFRYKSGKIFVKLWANTAPGIPDAFRTEVRNRGLLHLLSDSSKAIFSTEPKDNTIVLKLIEDNCEFTNLEDLGWLQRFLKGPPL